MNLLAHALLARSENDDVLTVNVLWDFLGRDLRDDPRVFVKRGSSVHRLIDRETDTSPEFAKGLNLVSERRQNTAGIIVDIALDFALSQDWSNYSNEGRLDFIDTIYERMTAAAPSISEEAERLVSNMKALNWFKSYGEIEGLKIVFQRMAQRNRLLDSLVGAEVEILSEIESYAKIMRSLYPKIEEKISSL